MVGKDSWMIRLISAAAALSLVAACNGDDDDEAPRRSNDATATTSLDSEYVAVTELVTGDCLVGILIGRQQTIEIDSASIVDCTGHHDLEVFNLFELTPEMVRSEDMSVYPGRGRVGNAAEVGCNDALDDVGVNTDLLGAISIWPSKESWETGDRTVACAIYLQDGRQFDGRQLDLQAPDPDN